MPKEYRDYSDASKVGWAIIRRHGVFQVVAIRYRVGSNGQYVALVDPRFHSGEARTLREAQDKLAIQPDAVCFPGQMDSERFRRWW